MNPPAPLRALLRLATPAGLLLLAHGCAPGTSSGGGGIPGPEQTLVDTPGGRFMLEARPLEGTPWEAIPASPDRTFQALADAYALLEIPPGTVDPEEMVYGNPNLRAAGNHGGVRLDRLFNCGRAGGLGDDLARSRPLQISIVSQVRGVGRTRSLVRTEATARVRGGDVTSVRRSPCISTGVLEASIRNLVRELVAAH